MEKCYNIGVLKSGDPYQLKKWERKKIGLTTMQQPIFYNWRIYKTLLQNQLRWLNRDGEKLRDITCNLYINRSNNTLPFRVQKNVVIFDSQKKNVMNIKNDFYQSFQALEYDGISMKFAF